MKTGRTALRRSGTLACFFNLWRVLALAASVSVDYLLLQVVLLQMERGDQVYVELMSGRKLCNQLSHNVFTGHIIYPGE